VGTVRRLQALVAIGYTQSDIAIKLAVHVPNLSPLLHGAPESVAASTASAVASVFDRLWMYPVAGAAGERARLVARSHRWVSPLAWDDIDDPAEIPNTRGPKRRTAGKGPDADGPNGEERTPDPPYIDEIAVERAMNGEPIKLTYPERLYAVQRLHRRRWSDGRIARTLHVDDRTILRNRKTLGLPAWEIREMKEAESA